MPVDRSVYRYRDEWYFVGDMNIYRFDGTLTARQAYRKARNAAPWWDYNSCWENLFNDPQWFPHLADHL